MRQFACFSFVLCVLLSTPLSAQPYDLRYRLKVGSALKYKKLETQKSTARNARDLYAEIDKSTEAFVVVKAEKAEGSDVVFTFLQDTAFVEDHSKSAVSETTPFDIQNAVTKKPVRVRMSSKGDFRSAEFLVKPELKGTQIPLSEKALARQAAMFPVLPQRSLKIGDTWTDALKDTTPVRQKDAKEGEGNGVRYRNFSTNYTVDSLVLHNGHKCLKVSWQGKASIEAKMIYKLSDSFNEEESSISGVMYFAAGDGMLVELFIHSEKNASSAVFGLQSEVVPSMSVTETRWVLTGVF